MIEDGDAEGVAVMMALRGMIFPAFIALLVDPRWSVRLGAMVVFEALFEKDPGLAGEVVEPLLAAFSDVDDMVKGDVIHILGESGNRKALSFLRSVAAGDYDDEVRAAAAEAMGKLK
jgi:HEAT repeat protein